ncbi:hypothetical protein [Tuwongella immobilis]|uniref:Uncharacterized protein n=1 Tax=Tuwongella immobilis TaxID=692036 RepID=A0A6C2YUM7_9BACT|nr:hypothetical protein [Tuwongella immobilis]VIP05144.1 Uncharacterized protein OS=Lysobacter capsici AZ78 GN=AZ78_15985 PE=4 SV=1 [Tuwongella immobilis]VTS07644.1 Uncharacterized protein OS=Lysobacter capsici AZ78 GN=AZ78_15985 PE=4 SV=1 [Tuwongella immobilis]
MNRWIEYAPVDGWALFERSAPLIDALWNRLPEDDWHYMNFVVGSSLWESRRDASMVSVHINGEQIVHLATQDGDAGAVIEPLASEFGLVPIASWETESNDASNQAKQE